MFYVAIALDQLLQYINDEQEQVWGQRVPLAEPPFAGDPWAGTSFTSTASFEVFRVSITQLHQTGEVARLHDLGEEVPIHGVEGLYEVEFQDQRRQLVTVAALDKLDGVDEVLRDRSPFNEARLVWIDQAGNVTL
jgi:hypothetical protein